MPDIGTLGAPGEMIVGMAGGTVPQLKTLQGLSVVLTGQFSTTQAEIGNQIVRVGRGRVASKVSGTTDVVVQGEPSPIYKFQNEGLKLVETERQRRLSRLIYVISEIELQRLLAGEKLSAEESAAAAGGAELFGAGVPFRQPTVKARKKGQKASVVDLDERDRRLGEHHDLASAVADFLLANGRTPLSPISFDCYYDVAWQPSEDTVHIVEVKTTTAETEIQQMRLGLGQVLEYRQTMEDRGWDATPHLVVPSAPAAKRVERACEACEVTVSWPGCLDRILDE